MIEVIGSAESTRRLKKLATIKERSVALNAELIRAVGAIIDDVRQRGDEALLDYTAQFDNVHLDRAELRVDEQSLRRSAGKVDRAVLEALREAIKRIRVFHEHEREESWEMETTRGLRLGKRITPIERAGLYVPGGTVSYPSSVLMNVVHS